MNCIICGHPEQSLASNIASRLCLRVVAQCINDWLAMPFFLILEPLCSTSSHTTPLSFAAHHPVSSHFNSHTPSFSEEPSHPSHPSSKNSELLQSKQRKTMDSADNNKIILKGRTRNGVFNLFQGRSKSNGNPKVIYLIGYLML